MVTLTLLSSIAGNQGSRTFPYQGYLGLTPVNVDGIVRTKVDSDLRPLPATSVTISVRCYEYALGRTGVQCSNMLVDQTAVLWSKPDGQDCADVGDLDIPFRITLPIDVDGLSTVLFVEWRCLWKIEAVIHHLPIVGVGNRLIKHYDLPFLRYSIPPNIIPALPTHRLFFHPDLFASPMRFCLCTPPTPTGPMDLVPISVRFIPPDNSIVFKSASLVIERRLVLHDSRRTDSTLLGSTSCSSPLPIPVPSPSPSRFATPSPASTPPNSHTTGPSIVHSSSLPKSHTAPPSLLSLDSDSNTLSPLLPSSGPAVVEAHSRCTITPIVSTEFTTPFTQDSDGSWINNLTVQWPAAKSSSRWAVGETVQTRMASVKFIVRVKVVISSSSGNGSIDLPEQEIIVVSTNSAQRQLAISKYNESQFASENKISLRSKSKSPKGSRRHCQTDMDLPRTDDCPSSVRSGSSKSSSSRSRRPHTSAGPRDKKQFDFSSATLYNPDIERRQPAAERAISADRRRQSMTPVLKAPETSSGAWRTVYIPEFDSHGEGREVSSPEAVSTPHHVQAWEEELRRIEQQSRRSSSQMLGLFSKRDRQVRDRSPQLQGVLS